MKDVSTLPFHLRNKLLALYNAMRAAAVTDDDRKTALGALASVFCGGCGASVEGCKCPPKQGV